jgi:hypothetical protein
MAALMSPCGAYHGWVCRLKLLKMRHVLNPKHFMKADKGKKLPKYFQIGTEINGPADYYTQGASKKKTTMVDELLADASFRKYHKNKYNQIQAGAIFACTFSTTAFPTTCWVAAVRFSLPCRTSPLFETHSFPS